MTQVDPIGALVTELQGVASLTAIIGAGKVMGQEQRVPAPCVVVVQLDDRPSISGPRTGTRSVQVAVRCVAPKGPTGDILALQIARTVREWFHERGPRKSALGVAFYLTTEQNTGAVLRDPDTDEPYVLVMVNIAAAASAVA